MSDLPPSDMSMFLQLISSDLRKLLQPVNGWSVVYAALTTAFLGLLTSSIIAPVSTLTSILPAASTPECIALWRNVGAALLVLPAWTVNLKVCKSRLDDTAAAQNYVIYMCGLASHHGGGKPAQSIMLSWRHTVRWPLRAT